MLSIIYCSALAAFTLVAMKQTVAPSSRKTDRAFMALERERVYDFWFGIFHNAGASVRDAHKLASRRADLDLA